MNYIIYSEYEYDDFLQVPDLEPYTYLDCRNMSKAEIECRWASDEDTVFFLGNNGMAILGLTTINQVWVYDKEDDEPYFSLEDFIDVQSLKIEDSYRAYQLYRTGKFGGLKTFSCVDYKMR